jgi:hypothetical protein
LPPSPVVPKTQPAALHSLEKSLSAAKPKKRVFLPAAVVAFVIFVLVNVGCLLRFGTDDSVKGSATDSNRELWSGAGSIDITTQGFQQLRQTPQVVLLGSSLIMHPFWSMDAELGSFGDIFHHHESFTLAHDLGLAGLKNPCVYSLAVFGEMISDAYIYVNEFLKGDKLPKLVVFGIAPRDFSDDDLPSPTASFTFKRLIGLKNFARYADAYMPGWQERSEFIANHGCYLYSKRWRVQHELARAVEKGLQKIGIGSDAASSEPGAGRNEHAGFMLGGSREERFLISTKEYTRRYHNIGEKNLSLQKDFLERVLTTCQERGVKVLLVNMPLTPTNRGLLPPGFYDNYRADVARIAKGHRQTQLIDLGDSNLFKDVDYWDTAHLNNKGGHKLLKCIEPAIMRTVLLQQ